MNYIELINKFWLLHEEHSFCTTEIALFFYLLKINNQCSWKESFRRNNSKIEADLRISFNTMKNARNKLQQSNVIDFKTKNGSSDVSYKITLSNFDEVGDEVTIEVGDEVAIEVGDEVVAPKDKLNKTKPKQTNKSKSHSETAVSGEDSVFKNLVKIWFEFHYEKYQFKPTFSAIDGKKLKALVEKLKKLSESKNFEFTNSVAEGSFQKFLNMAYQDNWIRSNFQLQILDSKFDSIIQKKVNNDKGIDGTKGAMAAYKEQLLSGI